MSKRKSVWDWKIDRHPPFLHFFKREQYLVEEIEENYWKAVRLLQITFPIVIAAKIFYLFRKH